MHPENKLKVVFISNYFTHHQKPLSDALKELSDYSFIATTDMTQERRNLGWGYDQEPPYVYHYAEETEQAESVIAEADVVVAGSAPEFIVRKCIQRGQLVFRYSERPLKNGLEPIKFLPRLLKWHWQNPKGKKIYLLCASGYTAKDYACFGLFRGKAYRWGYFPETIEYQDVAQLFANKKKASILWVGRFLDWKHPDDAIAVATALKEEGYSFTINMIGTGPMEQTLRETIQRNDLEDCVHLLGSMIPEEVRRHMEETEIFLFTSDRKEGWGAVLNEAMNSGCAVVASDAAGSSPYLIRNEENGLLYRSGNVEELCQKTKALLDGPERASDLGRKAYYTITNKWCAEVAAKRLLCLAERLIAGTEEPSYKDGPCSSERI